MSTHEFINCYLEELKTLTKHAVVPQVQAPNPRVRGLEQNGSHLHLILYKIYVDAAVSRS
jgi:hypothetical protein